MDEFPVVYSYSRAHALADGVLMDAGDLAREAGFRVPVALTAGAWADCVAWSEADERGGAVGQSEAGRLWDVLFLARHAALLHGRAALLAEGQRHDRVAFVVLRVPRGKRRAERAELAVHIGPGDAGEPVITLMLPNED